MRIGIDLMGSDQLPFKLFEAVALSFHAFPLATFVLYLTEDAYRLLLEDPKYAQFLHSSRIFLQFAPEIIFMDEEPLSAIRHKKNASLMLGIKQLRRGEIDGFVSAGNTGAFVAAATLFLPRLPGIKRAALLALLPTLQNPVAIIDVGGNLHCRAEHLVQFAELGVAYQRCLKVERPRVGLLNIGVESKKGTCELQMAYELLRTKKEGQEALFIGNIEARDLFLGQVDVLVTDGFTGNVLLKTSEGVSSLIFYRLKELLQNTEFPSTTPLLASLYAQFDYEEYPGAILCGIEGVAIKCHGNSSFRGLWHAIQGAVQLVAEGFIAKIKTQLAP